ncbi:RNA polymerase sigma factor [Psychromicrobium lacuslunae]|uniref:RNA polymerase sigma factor n=1 Tax=Psychromicrobium lacuslunae TaxID=1618207 RepID=A0A0D4C4A4_9MICC|nr:sigma-70 family RNA polymerase sigma factor [Psychromicrobium lacuslunae]AJT43211.1 RNA polymerase sigma 70 [Psychromicrobium lacuslunae]
MDQPKSNKLSTANDAFLVERALNGDIRAFEILARRYALLMRSYAGRLLSSHSEAEDVVQEALVVAWKTLDSLQEPAKVKSWLMRIVSRKSIDLLRKRKDSSGIDDLEIAAPAAERPERQALAASQLSALSAALSQLPETQRRCWTLREVGEHSYQEIADELGLSVSTVRGQLARARATLMKEMEDWR